MCCGQSPVDSLDATGLTATSKAVEFRVRWHGGGCGARGDSTTQCDGGDANRENYANQFK